MMMSMMMMLLSSSSLWRWCLLVLIFFSFSSSSHSSTPTTIISSSPQHGSDWPNDCWVDIISPSSHLIRQTLPFHFSLQCDIELVSETRRQVIVNHFVANTMQFCVTKDQDDLFASCFSKQINYFPKTDWITSTLTIEQQLQCLTNNNYNNNNNSASSRLTLEEVCTNNSNFNIVGFKTVTLPYITYIKEIHNDVVFRHNFAWAMFDLDSTHHLPTFQQSLQLLHQRGIVHLNHTVFQVEYNLLHIFHWQELLQRILTKPRTLASVPATLSNNSIFADIISGGAARNTTVTTSSSRRYRMLFFFKELQRHGANNRMLQWIALLNPARYELHVLTGDHDGDEALSKQLREEYHVQIHITQVLQPIFINQFITTQQKTHTDLNFTSIWLEKQSNVIELLQRMDYLVLTNCVGSLPTVLFLQGMVAASNPSPIVIMDASNPAVPHSVMPYIDVVIAPSKASALQSSDPFWNYTGIPLAVIYPVLSKYWLEYGYCFLSQETQKQRLQQLRPVSNASDDERKFRFLYVGRLATEKNPGLIFRALHVLVNYEAQLQHSYEHVELNVKYTADPSVLALVRKKIEVVLVGDGPLKPMLQQWINMHQLAPYIHLLGSMDEIGVNDELLKADVLLNPGIYGETFGYVHLEAFANGLPVIAFNRGAAPESVMYGMLLDIDTQHYSERYPIQLLAEAMIEMLLYRERDLLPRDDICNLARQILPQRFALEKYVRNFEDILQLYASIVQGDDISALES